MRNNFLFLLFYLSTRRHIEANCPVLCDQSYCNIGTLLCSDFGLSVIPEIPPPKTTKITISNQRFSNPVLGYRNLSKYGTEEITLKSLTIRNCSLQEIESESFTHLIHLTEMDLSQNDLRMIHSKTFKALTLKSLILDGNRLLKLASNSFQGLVVSALSLADCGLNELTFDSIKEISGHLTKLNLSKNRLKSFSRQFYLLFKRLEDIQLEKNQLKCDCRLKWLKDILKTQKQSYSSIACFNPLAIRGKTIANLDESQFICPKPDLKTISVDISSKSAILFCSSSASSDSFVSWHLQFKDSYRQIRDLIENRQNASITIEKSNQFDKFFCVVKNENGNVSVDLNIRWPNESTNDSHVDRSDNRVLILTTRANESSKSDNSDDQIHNYLFLKQFTFLEMILSIGSTFVVTTITFALIYFFLSRRMNLSIGGKQSSNKTGSYQGVVYSDSAQIYDSPRYSSPHKSFQTAHLLDFKTQKRLSEDLQ